MDSKQRLSRMSLEQRTLLERRLLGQHPRANEESTAAMPTSQPLSWAQEGLWFLYQWDPKGALYNIPQAFRLRGALNRQALGRALAAVVERHEALRTRFETVNGTPLQRAWPAAFEMRFVELSGRSGTDQELELQRLLDEEATRPFNLSADLPIRAQLIRLGDEDHVLTISVHHIVSDYTSLAILHDEIGTFYRAFLENRPPVLPRLTLQFPEWAARQRQAGDSATRDGCVAYWKERLAGAPWTSQVPTDRPRPERPTFRGGHRPIALQGSLVGQLKQLSGEQGSTFYMLLLAAWQTLLARFSGQEDLVVASPLGQRGDPECQRMIGLLINTVALRADLSGDPTFRELLERVREVVVGAFARQEMPFEKLGECLGAPNQGEGSALCPVMFQYLPFAPPKPELMGLTVETLPLETGTAKFELTLTLMDAGEGIAGDLEYNTDLYDAATVDRMLGSFGILLESIAANPDERIGALEILTPAEKEQVLFTWNETDTHYPRHATVHQLFEEQAARSPDAVAIISENGSINYRDLNCQANQVARYLVRKGVTSGDRVGLCFERSPSMIAALLAILKAGAAYVPLDPKYPGERLGLMLREARVHRVLTTSALAGILPAETGCIPLDGEEEAIARESDENLPNQARAEDLAYVIYTSGSTGQPKGVAIAHRGIVRLVKNTNYLGFDSNQVFLQFAPLCFDASTFEIWGPLLNGARLALYPPVFDSLEQFARVINRYGVTTLWLTAGLFHQVVEQRLDALKGIRQLLAGGDVLSVPHVLKVLNKLPACELMNGYGPTENTTFTCCYRFPHDWNGSSSAPIGRPISNTQVYILDRRLAPVPVGVSGELWIGGDGLALGYLNAPELTNERFVPCPFDRKHRSAHVKERSTGTRLYRTGDRARFLPDGTIEFIGRADDQVKINGFRIHLGEVEAIVRELPGVRQAAVLAEKDSSGSKQLVAWVSAESGASGAALRQALRAKVPAYMIPARIELVDEMPIGPNGKVDRKKLQETERRVETNGQELVGTPAHEQILQIWRAVFGRENISLRDNFFDLGGHSLMATRVISRINAAFQTNLSIAELFQAPTIPALAEKIASQPRDLPPGPIRRRPRNNAASG